MDTIIYYTVQQYTATPFNDKDPKDLIDTIQDDTIYLEAGNYRINVRAKKDYSWGSLVSFDYQIQ